MKIVVLAGGLSPEREVSLTSGTEICNALRRLGHQAILVNLFFGVEAQNEDELKDMFDIDFAELPTPKIGTKMPDVEEIINSRKLNSNEALFMNAEIGPNVIKLCNMADIVFLGLHGGIGENGKIQALFDIFGIKYTGAGSVASSHAMHKGIAKKLFVNKGVPAAKYKLFKKGDDASLDNTKLQLPLVVKICSGGSSLGVYLAHTEQEYNEAIDKCFEMEDDVLVEEFIEGREFAVPVLAGKALPVIEIIPESGWFDYEHKYQANQTNEVCPANIDEETTIALQNAAELACRTLGIDVYARPDFFVDNNGEIFCIEVNTLPGMTPASLFPKSAKVAGLDYDQFCEKIIEESMKKYE